jgi:hypothetical protein
MLHGACCGLSVSLGERNGRTGWHEINEDRRHIFIHLILFPAGVLLRAEYDVLTQLHDKTSTAVLPQYIKREEQ